MCQHVYCKEVRPIVVSQNEEASLAQAEPVYALVVVVLTHFQDQSFPLIAIKSAELSSKRVVFIEVPIAYQSTRRQLEAP